jgi:hypothetical protein
MEGSPHLLHCLLGSFRTLVEVGGLSVLRTPRRCVQGGKPPGRWCLQRGPCVYLRARCAVSRPLPGAGMACRRPPCTHSHPAGSVPPPPPTPHLFRVLYFVPGLHKQFIDHIHLRAAPGDPGSAARAADGGAVHCRLDRCGCGRPQPVLQGAAAACRVPGGAARAAPWRPCWPRPSTLPAPAAASTANNSPMHAAQAASGTQAALPAPAHTLQAARHHVSQRAAAGSLRFGWPCAT